MEKRNIIRILYLLVIVMSLTISGWSVSKSNDNPPADKMYTEEAQKDDIQDQAEEKSAKIPVGKDAEKNDAQSKGAVIPNRDDRSVSPNQISVEPRRPSHRSRLKTWIWMDDKNYRIGDSIKTYFRVTRPAYVYIYNIDSRGETRLIFPNYYDRDNYIDSNTTYYIPDRSYSLTATGPRGKERLQIVAFSDRCPHFDRYFEFSVKAPFPLHRGGSKELIGRYESYSKEMGGGKYESDNEIEYKAGVESKQKLSISVEGNRDPHYYDYAEDWTSFNVFGNYYDYEEDEWDNDDWGDDYDRPDRRYGSLELKTDPRNATVRINGEYRGKTPLKLKLSPGNYSVQIYKSDYKTWFSNVQIKGNSITSAKIKMIQNDRHYRNDNYDYKSDIKTFESMGGEGNSKKSINKMDSGDDDSKSIRPDRKSEENDNND